MREVINSWFDVIGRASPAAGVPLILIGLTLMFMGWQFHKTAVPFTYLLIGLGGGQVLAPNGFYGFLGGFLSEFEVPAQEVVQTTPWSYLRGFYDHLAETRPDISKRTLALAAVMLIGGFAWGTWFTRGALIVATALGGTLLFTAGLGAVAEALAPQGWDGRLAQHPKLSIAFLASCFLLSSLVQYRFTQEPPSSPAGDQPTTKPAKA